MLLLKRFGLLAAALVMIAAANLSVVSAQPAPTDPSVATIPLTPQPAAAPAPVVAPTPVVLVEPDGGTKISLTPVLDQWWELIVFTILGVVGVITAYFWKLVGNLTGEQIANQIRGYMNPVIENAVALALTRVKDAHLTNVNIDVKNKVVAEAANYAIARIPDALRFFGIKLDPADPALRKKIEAEIAKIMLKVDPQATLHADGSVAA